MKLCQQSRGATGFLTGLKQLIVSMTEYQVSSRAIRGMLALTVCVVAQIFSLLVFNSLRKRMLKRLTGKNIARLYKTAVRMAF